MTCSVTQGGFVCAPKGAGRERSPRWGWVAGQPETAAWRGRCSAHTPGSLSMPSAGPYILKSRPQELCRWCFPALRNSLSTKRRGKVLWGSTEKEEEIPHENGTLGSQNNLSSPAILGDN